MKTFIPSFYVHNVALIGLAGFQYMAFKKRPYHCEVISKLPAKERIAHCEHLIDKAQLNLMRNKKFLNKTVEEQLMKIIKAAQQEIKQLEKS